MFPYAPNYQQHPMLAELMALYQLPVHMDPILYAQQMRDLVQAQQGWAMQQGGGQPTSRPPMQSRATTPQRTQTRADSGPKRAPAQPQTGYRRMGFTTQRAAQGGAQKDGALRSMPSPTTRAPGSYTPTNQQPSPPKTAYTGRSYGSSNLGGY